MKYALAIFSALFLAAAFLPMSSPARSIHQEDLAPVAEVFGVGHAAHWWEITVHFRKSDGYETSQYGTALPSAPPNIVRSYRAWAIYDVSHINPPIQVQELTISNYLYPAVDAGHTTIFGRLTEDPRPLDPGNCWNALVGEVYAEVGTRAVEGEMTTVLGELANAEFQSAVIGDGLFMIRIEGNGDTDDLVLTKGWQEGMPRLTVVYDDLMPVESATWGMIKALFGP